MPRHRNWSGMHLAAAIILVTTLMLAGCSLGGGPRTATTPPLPALAPGWTWHHDSTLPLSVPVPPGWRAQGQLVDNPEQHQPCFYMVMFLPPSSTASFDDTVGFDHEPETMLLRVAMSCPPFSPERAHLIDSGTTVLFNGKQTVLFTNDAGIDAASGITFRCAVQTIGGQQYVLWMYAPLSKEQTDVAAYRYLVEHFTYTGHAA